MPIFLIQLIIFNSSLGYHLNFFLNSIFSMWTIFKVFIEFVIILLLFYVLVFWPRGMWDLSSLTRDQTHAPGIGRRSLNTGPPGKSHLLVYLQNFITEDKFSRWERAVYQPKCNVIINKLLWGKATGRRCYLNKSLKDENCFNSEG